MEALAKVDAVDVIDLAHEDSVGWGDVRQRLDLARPQVRRWGFIGQRETYYPVVILIRAQNAVKVLGKIRRHSAKIKC